MFDYRSNILLSEHMPEFVPIKSLVSDDSFYVTEISLQDLPSNLCVVW